MIITKKLPISKVQVYGAFGDENPVHYFDRELPMICGEPLFNPSIRLIPGALMFAYELRNNKFVNRVDIKTCCF